ncbi:MAG: sulfotransferase [Planctomycetes bacterium]|nr:sulfotransferase [Planctomycetota bacterium]
MTNAPASEPRFFVMGAGRSGTSLLQRILCRHPRLHCSHELRLLELVVLAGALVDVDGGPDVVDDAPRSPFGLEVGKSFGRLVAGAQLAQFGRAVYGDKYPPYCEQIHILDRLFPSARFVHIVRDGRDVVSSALQAFVTNRGWRRPLVPPGPNRLAEAWAKAVRHARDYGKRLGPARYFELRYEALSAAPAETMSDVFRFLGEEFGPELAASVAEVERGKTWRETLSLGELAEIDRSRSARDLLEELGYPPSPTSGDAYPSLAWTAGLGGAAAWHERGARARAEGDERKAIASFVRAIRGGEKDARAARALLDSPERAESLFAAFNVRTDADASSRAALSRWVEARGLDREAARALFEVGARP